MWLREYWFQRKCHVVQLFIFILSKEFNCENNPDYKIEAPRDVEVQRGLCVLISCSFAIDPQHTLSKKTLGFWRYKNNYGGDVIAASNDENRVSSATKGRFIMSQNVSYGDCSFYINDAHPRDARTYEFRVEDSIKFTYLGIKPKVMVVPDPEPEISPTKKLVAGEKVTLTCTSPGRCNENEVYFNWDGKVKIEKTQSYALMDSYGHITHSNITFIPSYKDHRSILICNVTYREIVMHKSITLNVEYPPLMSITSSENGNNKVENRSVVVKEHDSQILHCTVNSNPEANITWSRGDKVFNSTKVGQSLTLELQNISCNDDATYSCLAWNIHGSIRRTVNITVEYAPRTPAICKNNSDGCFVGENSTIKIQEGSSVFLLCSADSNPPSDLLWIKYGQNNTSISNLAQLNIIHLTISDEGIYICQATNKHGRNASSITIKIIPLPNPENNLQVYMIGAVCCLFLIIFLIVAAFFLIKHTRKTSKLQKTENAQKVSVSNSDVIYSNTQWTGRGREKLNNAQMTVEKQRNDLNPIREEPTVYMNYGEQVQYVTLDFSRMKNPREVTVMEETEYSEIKRK